MNALTTEQINHFHDKGWIGPLDTFTSEELDPIRAYVKANSEEILLGDKPVLKFHNSFLDYDTPRAHHFTCDPLAQLLADSRIVGRMNQLGEQDLLLWKSNFFHKMPGQAGIGLHQAIDYFGHRVDEDVPKDKKTLHFPEGIEVQKSIQLLFP